MNHAPHAQNASPTTVDQDGPNGIGAPAQTSGQHGTPDAWSPQSWTTRLAQQQVRYTDRDAVDRAIDKLKSLPPLVTSWEIERLKGELAEAQEGKRFILQGGDCAESLADCRPEIITGKLKILLQMSLVLVHELKLPVTRIGRMAGQYAKPRSQATETRTVDGVPVELPSYFGDLVNRAEFTQAARAPDPHLMVRGYQHAAMTLNFIRSLTEGGFADLHHPEAWEMGFLKHARLSPERRAQYEAMTANLADGVRFMEALGERSVGELSRVEFFTSHEGLNLLYESAQTRAVPNREGSYNLSTHLPWIGERTRQLDGAHVEFFRGVRNPVGVKVGPTASADDVLALLDRLNPANEPGKIVLISRMGAGKAGDALPGILAPIHESGHRVLWMCDPMHGNGITTAGGIKTRRFDDILREIEEVIAVHRAHGTRLGGIHFELTGEDVTECLGGATGLDEHDLGQNYASPCDPRLNYTQALELAFLLAGEIGGRPRTTKDTDGHPSGA